MSTTRQDLLLAYGIVEYQVTLDHLEALRLVGVSVPFITLDRLRKEQRRLMHRWLWDHGDPKSPRGREAEVLAECREWLSTNIAELEQLIDEVKEAIQA